jgi:hypothetical protein
MNRNPFKYSATKQDRALKISNFWFGTNDVSKGPTNQTGYYAGVDQSLSYGYLLFKNNSQDGLRVYHAGNDQGLLNLTRMLFAEDFSNINDCLEWHLQNPNSAILNQDLPNITTDSLVLYLDAGMVSSYPRKGAVINDLSDVSNVYTINNNIPFVFENNGVLNFNGVDHFISLGDLRLTTDFTLSMWFKGDPTPAGQFVGLINKSASNNFGDWGFYGDQQSRYVRFGFFNTNGSQVETSNTNFLDLIADEWVNYTGTYDYNKLILYRNGTQIASTNNSTTPTSSTLLASIGRRIATSGLGHFRGKFGSAMIYKKALTPDEVLQNYNATKGRFGL